MKNQLFDAAVAGDAATVRAILAAGEPVDALQDGWTPLHAAVEAGREEVVGVLLGAGADPNRPNASGYSPLLIMMICEVYTPQLARLLIEAGAEPGSPLHAAILLGEPMREALMRYVASTDAAGNTPLHVAVGARRNELIAPLIEAGTPVDAPDEDLTTPLMEAAAMGNDEAVLLLLHRYAQLELHDINGRTALIFAAGNAHEASTRLLLAAGAEVNSCDRFGNTALHYAYENEEFHIAALLLEAGADSSIRNIDGLRPEQMVP